MEGCFSSGNVLRDLASEQPVRLAAGEVRRCDRDTVAMRPPSAAALLLLLAARQVAGGWPDGGSPPEPERRRTTAEAGRYIVTLCPDATVHEGHEQLAKLGLFASRNFSRVLRGFALEGVTDALRDEVRRSALKKEPHTHTPRVQTARPRRPARRDGLVIDGQASGGHVTGGVILRAGRPRDSGWPKGAARGVVTTADRQRAPSAPFAPTHAVHADARQDARRPRRLCCPSQIASSSPFTPSTPRRAPFAPSALSACPRRPRYMCRRDTRATTPHRSAGPWPERGVRRDAGRAANGAGVRLGHRPCRSDGAPARRPLRAALRRRWRRSVCARHRVRRSSRSRCSVGSSVLLLVPH
jgi:hypothetical protein